MRVRRYYLADLARAVCGAARPWRRMARRSLPGVSHQPHPPGDRATPDVQVYEFRGLDAEIGIALYNSLPPVGHLHGDRFYILVKPGAPISHLMIGNADCLQDAVTVYRATAGIIKKAIERAAAESSI